MKNTTIPTKPNLASEIRLQRKKYYDNRKRYVSEYKNGELTCNVPNFKDIIATIEYRASIGDGYVTLHGYNYQLITDALKSEGFEVEASGVDLIVKWDMGFDKFSPVSVDINF